MARELESLRAAARSVHAHYEVQPEMDLRDGRRFTAALVLRLWAVHERGARALPGCERCVDLRSRLAEIAGFAIDGTPASWVTIDPPRAALYDSRMVPGSDEVALSIRLARSETGEPVGSREERAMKEIRARLGRLGIPER